VAALQMYLFCLFMRVLLSWFSSIDWNAQPWAFLRLVGGTAGRAPYYDVTVAVPCAERLMLGVTCCTHAWCDLLLHSCLV
jgi:hypothetical protein